MTLDDLVGVTSGDLIKITSGDLSGKMPSRKRVRPEVNHFRTHLSRIFMVFIAFIIRKIGLKSVPNQLELDLG